MKHLIRVAGTRGRDISKEQKDRQEYNFSMTNGPVSLLRWAGPFGLVGLALVAEAVLTPALGLQPSAPLLLAVALTGWFFGFRPSLLALFLSVLVLARIYWNAIPIAGTVVFVITGIALVSLIEAQRRAHRQWREKDELAARLLREYEAELIERKRAQAAEQRHSLRLEVTLSSIADGLVATNENGVITYINPVAQKMLGVARSQAEGQPEQTMLHFINEDTGETLTSPIQVALGFEQPAEDVPQRTLLVSRSGKTIPIIVNASAMKDSSGAVQGAVLVLHDLTHVRESELWTAEIAQKYAELNEVVPVPIWTSDVSNQRTYANSKWLELTGRTLGEALGTAWVDAVHPDDRANYLEAYAAAVEARTKLEAEYRLLAANGTYRWILERGVPRYSALGEYIGYIGSCVDITERKSEEEVVKRNEERLRTVNSELERLNAELAVQNKLIQRASEKKMRFLATMSHELRTPMNSILGFLQLLSEETAGPLNERQRRYVNRIQNGGQHLLKVVEQVLDYSKIEAGRLQLDCQDFEAGPVIEEIVAGVLQIDSEKRLNVSIQIEPDLRVWADPHRFRQILYNLLSNATKFTPDQGEVIVAAKNSGSSVRFSVTDTGPGIEPTQASAIFEEFFQGDSSMTESSRGTGLGLAITRRLVEAHGGRIKVDTAVGKGSSFIFSLPTPADRSNTLGETRAS